MNKLIKILIGFVILALVYCLATVTLTNHGQFINYYHYPSSSIEKSKENSNFIGMIPSGMIYLEGNESFKNFIKQDVNIWIDKFKVKKSFGILNLLPYDVVESNKRILRISYKDEDKKYSTSYKESIWIDFNGRIVNSLSVTSGRAYHVNDEAILKFYENENKTGYMGELKIIIK
ncbi:hypothetical protein [Tenacibaculum maritimum]|uniref:hypothetical protein n=1 Tax=Tenacibaculum maritimum TaxID=107401 RepID=UPI0012E44E27|nr:hypothetical protein [Tenacibaculum maritimum]CAA0230508.1 hypothetical protein TMP445_650002 [Tenacibaculum maritimum]